MTTTAYTAGSLAGSQIGRAIAQAREAAGLEQAEAAERLGIHPQTLSKYERGAIKKVPINVLHLTH